MTPASHSTQETAGNPGSNPGGRTIMCRYARDSESIWAIWDCPGTVLTPGHCSAFEHTLLDSLIKFLPV